MSSLDWRIRFDREPARISATQGVPLSPPKSMGYSCSTVAFCGTLRVTVAHKSKRAGPGESYRLHQWYDLVTLLVHSWRLVVATVRKTITLTGQQDDWIKAQVEAGHYTND